MQGCTFSVNKADSNSEISEKQEVLGRKGTSIFEVSVLHKSLSLHSWDVA